MPSVPGGDYLPPTVARLLADDAEFSATVDRAIRKTESLKETLTRLGRTRSTPEVILEDTEAKLRLSRFEDRLDRLRTQVANARVDVTGDRPAQRRLDALDLQLRRVGHITARPNVNLQGVAKAELQLEALSMRLDALNDRGPALGRLGGALGAAGSHAPGLLGIGLSLAPAALPLAGVGLGAGAALLNPFAAATVGVGAFAVAAVPDIKKVTAAVTQLAKYQKQYEDATTSKQRQTALRKEKQLWEDLDPAQAAAVKRVQTLDATYAKFQHKLEPTVFRAMGAGAGILTTLLGELEPVARTTGDEIVHLENRAERAFQSQFWQTFFTFLSGEAPRAVNAFGVTIGHLGTGLAHLVEDFAPLGADFEHILMRVSKQFEHWTEGSGPGKFVDWVEANGPQAAKTLDALAHAIGGLSKPFMAVGQIELKALTPVLNWIGDMSDQHPEVVKDLGLALITLSLGLKAAQGAAAVSTAISTIDALIVKYGLLGRTATTAAAAEVAADTAGGGGGGGGPRRKGVGGLVNLGASLVFEGGVKEHFKQVLDANPKLAAEFGVPPTAQLRAATDAENKLQASIERVGQTLQVVGSRDLTGNTVAAIANRNAVTQSVTALFAYRDSLIASGQSSAVARFHTQQAAAALEGQLTQLYGNKKAVDALLRSLHAMPKKISTDVEVNVQVQAAQLTKLNRLQGIADQLAIPAPPKQHAAGGNPPMDGSVFTVGEQGKEVMRFYHGKLQVLTPAQARRVLGREVAGSLLTPLAAGNAAGYQRRVAAGEAAFAAIPGTAKQRRAGMASAERSAFDRALTGLYAQEARGERVVSHAGEFLRSFPGILHSLDPRNVAGFRRLDAHTEATVGRLSHQRTADTHLLDVAKVLEKATRGTSQHARAVRDLHRATDDLTKVDKTLTESRKDERKVDAALDRAIRLRHAHEAPLRQSVAAVAGGSYLALMTPTHQTVQYVTVQGSVWTERALSQRLGAMARSVERLSFNNGYTNQRVG